MIRKQTLISFLIYFLIIALGVFISFKFWWEHSAARFLGIIGVILFTFGCLLVSVKLTRLLVVADAGFGLSTVFNKNKHMAFSKKVSRKVYLKANLIFMILFFVIAGSITFFFMNYTNKHEVWQLKPFGEYQKIGISKSKIISKSKTVFFDLYHNSKKYSVNLYQKKFNVGDSAYVIFSTENPNILKWADDYDREK